jgi:hypothetical protein
VGDDVLLRRLVVNLKGQVAGVGQEGLGLLDGVDADLENLGSIIAGVTNLHGPCRLILTSSITATVLGSDLLEHRQHSCCRERPLCGSQTTPLDVETDHEGKGRGFIALVGDELGLDLALPDLGLVAGDPLVVTLLLGRFALRKDLKRTSPAAPSHATPNLQ